MFNLADTDEDEDMPQRSRRRRIAERAAEGDMDMQDDMIESIENLEDMKGHSVREWVCLRVPRFEIKNRFKQFLKTFVDDQGKSVYREKIKVMCQGRVYNGSLNSCTLHCMSPSDHYSALTIRLLYRDSDGREVVALQGCKAKHHTVRVLTCNFQALYLEFLIVQFFFLLGNLQSLVIDYNVLACEQQLQVLAYFLPEAPAEMLKIFDEVLHKVLLHIFSII